MPTDEDERDDAAAETKFEGERVAKVIARAGVASRRDAEALVEAGRVSVNGVVLESPAYNVKPQDEIRVDGEVIPQRLRTRAWLYHKPRGLVTTNRDPEGRPTVFDSLPHGMPRVVSVGRLDINTEGLLILTNDGGLARVLELPATGWTRKYRVRVHGAIDETALAALAEGTAVDGILYGPIHVTVDRVVGDNAWLTVALAEGKNREVKVVLGSLGLSVTRLIRVSFGPFQLGDLPRGEVKEIPTRQLKEQLGPRLAEEAGADFEAPAIAPPKRTRPADARPRRGGGEARQAPARRERRGDDAGGRRVLGVAGGPPPIGPAPGAPDREGGLRGGGRTRAEGGGHVSRQRNGEERARPARRFGGKDSAGPDRSRPADRRAGDDRREGAQERPRPEGRPWRGERDSDGAGGGAGAARHRPGGGRHERREGEGEGRAERPRHFGPRDDRAGGRGGPPRRDDRAGTANRFDAAPRGGDRREDAHGARAERPRRAGEGGRQGPAAGREFPGGEERSPRAGHGKTGGRRFDRGGQRGGEERPQRSGGGGGAGQSEHGRGSPRSPGGSERGGARPPRDFGKRPARQAREGRDGEGERPAAKPWRKAEGRASGGERREGTPAERAGRPSSPEGERGPRRPRGSARDSEGSSRTSGAPDKRPPERGTRKPQPAGKGPKPRPETRRTPRSPGGRGRRDG